MLTKKIRINFDLPKVGWWDGQEFPFHVNDQVWFTLTSLGVPQGDFIDNLPVCDKEGCHTPDRLGGAIRGLDTIINTLNKRERKFRKKKKQENNVHCIF